VEALSVTPFAPRALDRGLSGVLVSLMRLWDDRLNANQRAGELQDTDPLMPEIFRRIIHRAEMATGNVLTGTTVQQMLDERRDFWLNRVHNATDHRLGYDKEGQGVVELLKMPEPTQWRLFTCLNSLRDVEGTVKLIYNPNPAGLRTGPEPQ
jgi:hypothetical protein